MFTLSNEYILQFRRRPPTFSGINPDRSLVLRQVSSHPPWEGCYRSSRTTSTARWVLLNLLSGTEEGWRVSPHSGLERAESVPQGSSLPHAACCGRPPGYRSGGLVRINRPERRLLSRPYYPSSQAVPPLCFSGQGVPVQGSSVRAVSGPAYIYTQAWLMLGQTACFMHFLQFPFTGNAGQGPAWQSQPTSGGSTLARKAMVPTITETP